MVTISKKHTTILYHHPERKQQQQQEEEQEPSFILPYVFVGVALMHIMYLILQTQVPSWNAATEFCVTNNNIPSHTLRTTNTTTCFRPDLMAFQIISGTVFVVCALFGIYGWYGTQSCHLSSSSSSTTSTSTTSTTTTTSRLWASHIPEAKWLTYWNLMYQVWDFGISWRIPEFQQPILWAHHTAAAIVAYTAIRYGMLGYYAIFFMGLSEISSIFLVVLDLSRYIPPEPGSYYDQLVQQVCAPMFVITFLYYRVFLWWYPITINLLQDVRHGLLDCHHHHPTPQSKTPQWVLYLLLVLDIPMGCLQLYWMSLILQEVQSKASSSMES